MQIIVIDNVRFFAFASTGKSHLKATNRLTLRKTAIYQRVIASVTAKKSNDTGAKLRGLPAETLGRLRNAVYSAGGVRSVASASGVPVSTLNDALSGASDLRSSAMAALARACGVSLDWLMFGDEPLAPATPAPTGQDLQGLVWVARYEVAASAGNGAEVVDEPRATHWPVPKEMLRGLARDPRTLAFLEVGGDSMAPTLADGDPIIIDQAAVTVDREAVYVLSVGPELFIKRVRRAVEPDGRIALVLVSDNRAYPDIEIGADSQEHVRVIGRVVWPNTSRR